MTGPINHAPYHILAYNPHGVLLGAVQVRSEWRSRAGKIEAATNMLTYACGWSVKHLFKVGKILGWTFHCDLAARPQFIDPEWKARHTAPKVRAPYGSLTRNGKRITNQ